MSTRDRFDTWPISDGWPGKFCRFHGRLGEFGIRVRLNRLQVEDLTCNPASGFNTGCSDVQVSGSDSLLQSCNVSVDILHSGLVPYPDSSPYQNPSSLGPASQFYRACLCPLSSGQPAAHLNFVSSLDEASLYNSTDFKGLEPQATSHSCLSANLKVPFQSEVSRHFQAPTHIYSLTLTISRDFHSSPNVNGFKAQVSPALEPSSHSYPPPLP